MRFAIASVLLLAGCVLDGPRSCAERGCSAVFGYVTVDIAHADHSPAIGLAPTIIQLATGAMITVVQPLGEGTYVVIDDNYTRSVDPDGEVFRFTAGEAMADFTIGTDECRCHVMKLAGPQVIFIP